MENERDDCHKTIIVGLDAIIKIKKGQVKRDLSINPFSANQKLTLLGQDYF